MKKHKHIELFAGCGGMSLGLEKAGFELYFANELSPMASETFAHNLLGENLDSIAQKKKKAKKTLWIRSQFPKNNLADRLRENPFEAAKGAYNDLDAETDLAGKLLVGDIDLLLDHFSKNDAVVSSIKKQDVDLLSGGPPCQSFSLAGKRQKNDHKNLLPLSFATISGLLQPKVVLLENVKGITLPFIENGEEYYAWLEVSKAFALKGFVPVCMMLNSKYFGVAQNRPRFILIAFREDIFKKLKRKLKGNKLLKSSGDFYKKVNTNREKPEKVTVADFDYYDIEAEPELFDGELLPKISSRDPFVSASDAIGDLRNTLISYRKSTITGNYGNNLNGIFKSKFKKGDFEVTNHIPRKHSFGVEARFRFYQVISSFQNGLKKSATDLFSGNRVPEEIKLRVFEAFSQHHLLMKRNEEIIYEKPASIEEFNELVKLIPTKKHSQRALIETEPAPAQLTIPDDLCHYHPENLRTMTVREMARFQSFPDWFEFRSKVTTGGGMRRFEVPQYTQVGNAVPPLLAKSLGETIVKLLKQIEEEKSI